MKMQYLKSTAVVLNLGDYGSIGAGRCFHF